LGDVRVAQKRPLDARAHYRAALDGEPESTRWLTALAGVLLQLDRFEQAEAKYRELIRIRPGSAGLHSALGFTLLRAGKLEAAVARYREAIRLDPDRAEVHGQLGTALFRSADIDGAIDAFRRALALEPDLSRVHAALGRAWLDSGRQVEAISAFRAAARLGQRQPTLLNNLAWLLATREPVPEGGFEEAIALASEAAEATGRLNPAILDTLAVAYDAAGRRQDALNTANEALKRAETMGDATLVERLQHRVRRLSNAR
ncbi:MAG: tetratricopeptide repeat protein, partial [Myxococcota bacterium]